MKKFFLLFFPLYIHAGNDSLVGVWQDMNILASGWSNTFMFYPDGKFKFFYNQMDCAKRVVSFAGKWSIQEEDVINLYITEKKIIEGGKLIKSQGSCASDSMIVEGYEKVIILKEPELLDYSISRIYKDNENDIQRDVIYIDAIKFWRFGNDPEQIINQFE